MTNRQDLHGWYIFSWEGIGCVADQQACLTYSAVKR